MTWIRIRFTLLLTLLTVWIAAMFASGVVAIAAFTSLPDLELSTPAAEAFYGDDTEGVGRYVAGFVTNPVFVASDRIRSVAAIAILLLIVISRGRILDRRCRVLRYLAGATLKLGLVILAYTVIVLAPDIQTTLTAWRAAVTDGDVERGAAIWKSFEVLHTIASTLLRIEFLTMVACFVLSSFVGPWRPPTTDTET